MNNITAPLRTLAPLLLSLFVLTGCRMYGGYGTVEKTVAEIDQANEQFARLLTRAENDVLILRDASKSSPALVPLADRMEVIVREHEGLSESHRSDLSRLTSGWAGYRSSSRLLGSIVTDQHRIANAYENLVSGVAELGGWMRPLLRDPATYQQVPPYYLDVEYSLGMPDLAQAVRSGS